MNIRIKNNQKKKKLSTAKLRSRLACLLRISGVPDAELSVLITGDRAMRTLNRTWRRIDRTTDVLSFSLREGQFPEIQPQALGDIVISLPQAERQARDAGHSIAREMDRLLVHGILHLLGHDHERSSADAVSMRRKERQLLMRLMR